MYVMISEIEKNQLTPEFGEHIKKHGYSHAVNDGLVYPVKGIIEGDLTPIQDMHVMGLAFDDKTRCGLSVPKELTQEFMLGGYTHIENEGSVYGTQTCYEQGSEPCIVIEHVKVCIE